MEKIIKQQVDNNDSNQFNSVGRDAVKNSRRRGNRDSVSSKEENKELSASRLAANSIGRKSPFDNQKKVVPKPNVRDRSKTAELVPDNDDVLSLIDENENKESKNKRTSNASDRSLSGNQKRS